MLEHAFLEERRAQVLDAFNPKNGSDIYGPLVVVGIQSNDSGLGTMPSHRNPFINF